MVKVAIYGLMIASVTLCLAWIWEMISPQRSPRREVKVRSQRPPTSIRRKPARVERSLR